MSQQPSGTTPYTINLDRFHVYNPRALFADTDFVTFLVQLNGNNVVPPQTIRLNNVGKGDYKVGMQVPIPAFTPGDRLSFSYQIVNSGAGSNDVEKAMNTLSDWADKLCTGIFGFAAVWDEANKLTHQLNDLIFGLCDGYVAGDAIVATDHVLDYWMSRNEPYSETRNYPGTDSAAGCGSNSSYSVTWSVSSPVPAQYAAFQIQDNWRWCNKCQGLAYAGNPSLGPCPAGGMHDHSGSGDYMLKQNISGEPGQDNWRWCNKCQGLAFAGNPSPGACPAGGTHDHSGSGDYTLAQLSLP